MDKVVDALNRFFAWAQLHPIVMYIGCAFLCGLFLGKCAL
jgi:hypothetical protein